MKKVKLNVSERLYAVRILNQFKGSLDKLSVILEDIKQFPMTDKEWETAERVISGEGETTTWKWNDEKGGLKEIEIQSETARYIVDDIEKKDKAGELTLEDRTAIDLLKKIR